MSRKKPEKPDEPRECCVYCEQDAFCCWTVMVGNCGYAMCAGCEGEAKKDFFVAAIRTDLDRERSKKGYGEDTSGE